MKHNLKISLYFFIAAIAGTLLHECGHALVAWYYGFHPKVHYAYCSYISSADRVALEQGSLVYSRHISNMVTLGGPVQTIVTGFIGFAALLVLRRRTVIDAWNSKHLFWIVLTFFHSREVFNVLSGYLHIATSRGIPKSIRADESRLFSYWGINIEWGYAIVLLVSSLILAYTTFVLVKKHRWQLIVFGAIGSLLGGWFWLFGGGKWLMP